MVGSTKRYIFTIAHGELSLAEIQHRLTLLHIPCKLISIGERFVILDIDDLNRIDLSLGGSFKIGEVYCSGKSVTAITKQLGDSKLLGWLPEKIRWAISYYSIPDDDESISNFDGVIAEMIKKGGASKAKRVSPDISDNDIIEISSKKIEDDLFDIILAHDGNEYYLGHTVRVIKSTEFYDRDLKRPFQDSTISIPPRIARILVNLVSLPKHTVLLDPFCGTGTILMEALALGLDVVGVDLKKIHISGTRENLRWFARRMNSGRTDFERRVKVGDARLLQGFDDNSIDGIATEPILISKLKKFPEESDAWTMLKKSERTYSQSLQAMNRILKPGGSISIVTPYIRTKKRMASFDFSRIVDEVGLEVNREFRSRFPLFARHSKEQKVIRGIWLLKKP